MMKFNFYLNSKSVWKQTFFLIYFIKVCFAQIIEECRTNDVNCERIRLISLVRDDIMDFENSFQQKLDNLEYMLNDYLNNGITGERGFQGDPGQAGVKGLQGLPGPDGLPGLSGIRGEKGLPGIKGVKGHHGNTGPRGCSPNGLTGDRGQKGDMGQKGDKGDQPGKGWDGIDRFKGDKGEKGEPTSN